MNQLTTRLAVFLLGLCALINIYSTQPLLTEIASDFGVPVSATTWTISATTIGVAFMAPFAGAASDRLGRKRVMVVAVSGQVAVTLACAGAWDFGALLALRFAQGLLIPFVFAVAVAYLAEEFPGAAANALYVAGTAFGGFCGRFLAGAASSSAGWRSSFVVLAVVLLLVLMTTIAWLPVEKSFQRSTSLQASLRGLVSAAADFRLLGTCFVGATLLFLQVGAFTYAGLHLTAYGLSTFEIGAVFAVFLVSVVVTPLTGRLIGRIGRRWTFVAASAISLGGLALTLVPSTPAVVIGLAGSSTGVFSGQACAIGRAAESSRASRSGSVGLYLTAYYAGGAVGAVAPAALYVSGGWPACVALLAMVTIAGAVAGCVAWSPSTTEKERT